MSLGYVLLNKINLTKEVILYDSTYINTNVGKNNKYALRIPDRGYLGGGSCGEHKVRLLRC